MKVSTILDQIDLGSIALPEFQRGYVWNRDQVRSLMDSLYRKHPVGSLLVWTTNTSNANARGDAELSPGYVKLLLDGQQRITSLYGIIRGKPPKFFDGNEKSFLDLYFNIDDEVFEFYGPLKMKENPLWINITDLMQKGLAEFITKLSDEKKEINKFINRLNAIQSIKDHELHIEDVTGEDKTVDIVVDIFNRVNSGGTKLSKGDLALAKICAEWPEAREEMKKRLEKWRSYGFNFRIELFLRCINSILTGEALFSALKDVDTDKFKGGLKEAEKYVDYILNLISSRLGLDHDRVLSSIYSFPLIARYLKLKGGKISDPKERDKLLYWYIHTLLWGRYSGSVESVLNQDLETVEKSNGSVDQLIDQLRQNRGDLRINANDFIGWSRGARFYPLLYMLTRVGKALDWETGIELSSHMLGKSSKLHVHHIFPKSKLYKYGYEKQLVNAVANFTFLTQDTNLTVFDRLPEDYFEEYSKKNPEALFSHWIPKDKKLWKIENFEKFLIARRELLAQAANDFLDSLVKGEIPEHDKEISIFDREVVSIPGGIESEREEEMLKDCNNWVSLKGLPEGELSYELTDEKTGEPLAVIDLAWPEGLQQGLSEPVAILIDESKETVEIVNQNGFHYFTNIKKFKDYVEEEILKG